MRKSAAGLILTLLFVLPFSSGHAQGVEAGKIGTDTIEMNDKSKEPACDCCQKCKAAKSNVETQEEEGPAADDDNGCEECCARCGRPLEPSSKDAPPEVIDQNAPPDIIQKQKERPE